MRVIWVKLSSFSMLLRLIWFCWGLFFFFFFFLMPFPYFVAFSSHVDLDPEILHNVITTSLHQIILAYLQK